ncbi:hypothetical protein D3H55_22690 [Bacillus salacetis]|uniref:DUF5673 domain-containing protein n=1 Tax=Bacillus salacetis TaxID=2315464 RepID=A0A3A1QM02_9BACI|nr:hypothetical protein [Bacillus salacetis]RIW27653.1 hypothetical protein D3H55_22690 [Bacillus salacetis]
MLNLLFGFIFISGIYYLVRYRLNLRKAAESAPAAVYPQSKEEFSGILLPGEWLEMEPLNKESKSYRVVNWGTYAALALLFSLLGVVLATDWLDTQFIMVSYLFFIILSAIRHRGNFFILPNGVILNARYYPFSDIKVYETERIVRWHELYGLDERADNGYKLAFKIKNKWLQPHYVVIQHKEQLDKVTALLKRKGVTGVENEVPYE